VGKFPDSYLELNLYKLVSELDLAKIPSDIKMYARNYGKQCQDEIKILAKGIVDFSNLVVQEHPDTIVLLDKSARPISYFLKSLWRKAYSECRTPDIRFVNIGREYSDKYDNENSLIELYKAHFRYINNKNIIIADEFIEHGDSITKAKETIRKVFPYAKRLLCTSVFGGQLPFWYSQSFYSGLGVFDRLMPNDILWKVSEKDEPDTFVSKTIVGVARRHEQVKRDREYEEALKDTQKSVNEMHSEMGYLARIIARNCNKYSTSDIVIKPNLPWNVKYLNRTI
jgi:hypothetical protein